MSNYMLKPEFVTLVSLKVPSGSTYFQSLSHPSVQEKGRKFVTSTHWRSKEKLFLWGLSQSKYLKRPFICCYGNGCREETARSGEREE